MEATIVGIFNSYEGAERASREIAQSNIKSDEISIVRKDGNDGYETDNLSNGTVTGTAIGSVAGLVLGMGSVVVPGFGVLAAAGPVAGLLAGALTGGVAGSLIDLGIPSDASNRYENDIRQGYVLFSMPVNEENGGKTAQILRECGAHNVELHK